MVLIKAITGFLKRWPELLGLPLALLIFLLSAPLLRLLDPTAAVYDLGILQKIFLGVITLLALNAAVFMGIKFNFPTVYSYYKRLLIVEFFQITPWQRILLFLSLYSLLFVAGALIVSLY